MSRPAPVARSVSSLAAHELRLTARRGENVLVTLVVPVAVLLFFASAGQVPGVSGTSVDFLLPGAIALAVVAGGMVSLGIATAYERAYGVLKRLGGAPLPPWALLAAKLAAVAILTVLQTALLIGVGVAFLGWSPGAGWSPLLLVASLALGMVAFAGLGLLLAGSLRAEAVLALANGVFLVFLMLGGIVLPVDLLPEALRPVAAVLPATALADLLRISLVSGVDPATVPSPAMPALVLTAWAVVTAALASRFFRWD